MISPLSINFPAWLHPQIFPGVPFLGLFRWYGLMYVLAFATAYLVFKRQVKESALSTAEYTPSDDDLFSFFLCGILFLVVGARVFYTLVYDPTHYYRKHPLMIFLPIDQDGAFTGYAGMSYHGGFIGGLLGMIVWCIAKKKPVLKWIDVMVVSIPLGFTFGRLGNFCNAELYGRVTAVPWGMIFPDAELYSLSLPWVQNIVEKAGLAVAEGAKMVNLPRHPSQLYEAFFEGIVLWLVLWNLRKKKPFDGFLGAVYTGGYGVFRFIVEYFREPDSDMGYRFAAKADAPLYLNESLLNISTGQVLCLCMVLAALVMMLLCFLYDRLRKRATK